MPIARNEVSVARRFLLVVCSSLLVAACLTTSPPSVLGQGIGASGEQEGDVLPTPPKQSAAWTPQPTKLPTTLVSAAEHLFQLGLADPRGCEYREIEVLVGGYALEWKDSVEKTHGWVIPATPKQPRQFGVCWNGLVYPLLSIGKTADLRADALAAITAAEQQDPRFADDSFWMGYVASWHLRNSIEAQAVSHQYALPAKVCLLLRLGEIELAERLWNRWTDALSSEAMLNPAATTSRLHARKPYLSLAGCWAWALRHRATTAHLRGDDGLALTSAETLAKVGPALQAEARRRGFSPAVMADFGLGGDFDCDGLLADQRRRAQQRREKSAPAVRASEYRDPAKFWDKFRQELDRCPDKAQRIAFLIRQFEEVSALQQRGYLPIVANVSFSGVTPGGDWASQHPISLLLAAQGDEAVEPLLACLEKDDRLTRWQPFLASYPVGVRGLAKGALEQTLTMPLPEFEGQFAPLGPVEDESETPQAMAARLRAYWQRYKSVPPVERWYRTLADDQARDRWLVAARTIVLPAGVPVNLDTVQHGLRENIGPYSLAVERIYGDSGWLTVHSPAGEGVYGEPLRNKAAPSVTELMIKRAKALDEPINQWVASWRKLEKQEKELNEQAERLEKEKSSLVHKLDELYKQQWRLREQQEQIRGQPRAQDPFADPPQPSGENKPRKQQGESPAQRLKALKEQEAKLVALEQKLRKQYYALIEQSEEVDPLWDELIERQEELDKQGEELRRRHMAEGCGGEIALCLAKWDPAAAIPVLRRLTLTTERPNIELHLRLHGLWPGGGLNHYFAGLLLARIDLGDTTALDQYAAWIRGVTPEDVLANARGAPSYNVKHGMGRLLAPLWQHADHPAIAATTEWLFCGDESPWNPFLTPPGSSSGAGPQSSRDGSPWNFHPLSPNPPDGLICVTPFRIPLITLPAFRQQVARLLEDRREAGQVEVVSNEEIRTGVENGRDPTRSTVPDDPLCPPPGTKAPFRICDVCAYGLSSLDGAPKCELFWPEKERDRAVEACAGYLRQYGKHFRLVPQRYMGGDRYHVQLVFPALDRPATPEDVRQGDAVFSLDRQGTVRVCKTPRLPLAARWTTQTDYPVLRDKWDDAAQRTKKVFAGYKQDGIVWQAEELHSAGRWQRYYGFVGCHGLAKVPAEEIEFPWTGIDVALPVVGCVLNPMPLDDAFDISWTAPGPGAVFAIGDPLVCRLLVRNHSAMERTPPPLALSGDHPKPPGDAVTIDTQLCWMHPLAYWDWRAPDTPAPWTPLVPKRPARLVLNRPERPLGPGEQFEILRCDLNEQFGPLRAGQYGFRTKLISSKETRSQEEPDVFFQLIESETELSPGETPR